VRQLAYQSHFGRCGSALTLVPPNERCWRAFGRESWQLRCHTIGNARGLALALALDTRQQQTLFAILVNRFLFADDVGAEQTWQLLAWCGAHGATELTVNQLGLQGHSVPYVDRFDADMAAFRLKKKPRPRMSAGQKEDLVRSTDLWVLSLASIAVLRRYFVDGLFTYPTSGWEEGCLEEPTFYRDGAIICGIVSHEREGILALTASEHAEVAALGIRTRDRPEWL